jgi:hypothetical protein
VGLVMYCHVIPDGAADPESIMGWLMINPE